MKAHNFLSHLQFFKMDKIVADKISNLMLAGAFLGKVTTDIDFTDEAIVEFNVPVVKILF